MRNITCNACKAPTGAYTAGSPPWCILCPTCMKKHLIAEHDRKMEEYAKNRALSVEEVRAYFIENELCQDCGTEHNLGWHKPDIEKGTAGALICRQCSTIRGYRESLEPSMVCSRCNTTEDLYCVGGSDETFNLVCLNCMTLDKPPKVRNVVTATLTPKEVLVSQEIWSASWRHRKRFWPTKK